MVPAPGQGAVGLGTEVRPVRRSVPTHSSTPIITSTTPHDTPLAWKGESMVISTVRAMKARPTMAPTDRRLPWRSMLRRLTARPASGGSRIHAPR